MSQCLPSRLLLALSFDDGMDNDNLEGDLEAWVDRELIAAMKVRSQIYRGAQ